MTLLRRAIFGFVVKKKKKRRSQVAFYIEVALLKMPCWYTNSRFRLVYFRRKLYIYTYTHTRTLARGVFTLS